MVLAHVSGRLRGLGVVIRRVGWNPSLLSLLWAYQLPKWSSGLESLIIEKSYLQHIDNDLIELGVW